MDFGDEGRADVGPHTEVACVSSDDHAFASQAKRNGHGMLDALLIVSTNRSDAKTAGNCSGLAMNAMPVTARRPVKPAECFSL